MLKSVCLVPVFVVLACNAYAQQEKAEPKKAKPGDCRMLAYLIRSYKTSLAKLPTRDDLQGEELKRWADYYETHIAEDEAIYERVCK
jgi:hypothetical protein